LIVEVGIIDCIKLDNNLNHNPCSKNRDAYGYNHHEGYACILSNPELIISEEIIKVKLVFWEYMIKDGQ